MITKQDIKKYENEEKWNGTEYNRIDFNIIEYAKNGTLSEDEKIELTGFLLTTHLVLLSDTIKQFCLKVVNLEKIDYLENDIKQFPDRDFTQEQQIIDDYNEIRSTIYNISSYTKNKQFNNSTHNRYENTAVAFQTRKPFSGNTDIQDKILTALKKLSAHKYNEIRYIEESSNCVCKEEFKGFNFYVDTCEAIQIKKSGEITTTKE